MGLLNNSKSTAPWEGVVYHWYQPYHRIGGIFMVIWGSFTLLLWSPVLIPLVNGEFPFLESLFALCAFFLLIPAPAYWMLLHFINKTTVKIKNVQLAVVNGPLPNNRPNHTLKLDDIRFILIEENRLFTNIETEWHIKAFMRNGATKYLFMHISELDEAMTIRVVLNRWLAENSRGKLLKEQLNEKKLSSSLIKSREECCRESLDIHDRQTE